MSQYAPAGTSQPRESADSRVAWVDYAKGICIIFVVMMHSTGDVQLIAGQEGWMEWVVQFARPFRMPDFFLISGLFLSRVIGRDWVTFFDRRVLHFFYFYFVWFFIQFAFKLPAHLNEEGTTGTIFLFLRGLTYDPYGTLWFVWILPFFAVFIRLTRAWPAWVLFALGATLETLRVHTGFTAVDEFASRFVYYYAGYKLAEPVFALAERLGRRPLLACVGLVAWGLGNGWLVFNGYGTQPGFSLAMAFCGAGAVITVAVLAEKGGLKFLRFLGEHSIVIYLTFFLPMKISRTLLLKTGVISDLGTVTLIVTACGVLAPFAVWAVARRFGWHFLYERPAWARWERRKATVVAA